MKSGNIIVTAMLTLTLSAQVSFAQGQADPDSGSAPTEPSAAQFLRQITELENTKGPYDSELGEYLYALGLLYMEQAQYREANSALERALHIRRTNDGLESESLMPILNALVKVTNNAGMWEALNKHLESLLWLHQKRFEPEDEDLLQVVEAVGRWKLVAYSRNLIDESKTKTLNDGIEVFETHIDRLEEEFGKDDPRLVPLLNGLALLKYQAAENVTFVPLDTYPSNEPREIVERVCFWIRLPDGSLQQVCEDRKVSNPNYLASKQVAKDLDLRAHMNMVKQPLQQVVNIHESHQTLELEDHAKALLNLGDWHFTNGNRGQANDHYKRAYQILEESEGNAGTLDELFGKPRRIPSLIYSLPQSDDEVDRIKQYPYVKVSFDVTKHGQARKIKIVEQSEPSDNLARKMAREHIKSSLFRPRFENGKPVKSKNNVLYLTGMTIQRASN